VQRYGVTSEGPNLESSDRKEVLRMPSVPVARPSGLQDLVPLAQLELDANNPRLASGLAPGETPTQEALVRVLWEEMAVDE
jgi:hypothetical protein